jgi:hypothetical protein
VRDASGGAVPDATIEVANSSRGIQRGTTTNVEGVFTLRALPPSGGYTLTVIKPGFAERKHSGLEVAVGENTNVEVTLELPFEQTKVVVEEAALVSDQGRTGLSQVVRNSDILNLPINGRRVDRYVLLTPAVVPDGVQGLVSFRGIAGGNTFLTDGNDTSNQFFHENAGRTRISAQISQDAVQEFQVLSTGYSAEYGRASGGIINTVTRTGENNSFGTAYWFFRNSALNARDPHSVIKPSEERHQAGASIGGKLVRDKLFYFLNTEIHRRDFPIVSSLTRPPLFSSDGRFVGTCEATADQCSAALAFLNRHFRLIDRSASSELGFARIDAKPSYGHSVSASFNYLKWVSPNGFQTQGVLNNGEGLGANGSSSVRTRYGRISWTALGGDTKINELRFGWFKDRHSDNLSEELLPPGTGLVQIIVQGQPNLGVHAELPRLSPSENRFQLSETFTSIAGKHTWKLGADLVGTKDYLRYRRNRHGTYEYADFTSFARDFSGNAEGARRWQAYSQRFGNEISEETIADYNFFIQDQYRARRALTFNYGLRYEYAAIPQPAETNPNFPQLGRIPSVKTNLAPRVGVAVGFHQSRTVLRAGYGIFYARYHGGLMSTFLLENGVFQESVQLERRFLADPEIGPVFPDPLPDTFITAPSAAGSATDLTLPSPDFRNPYTEQADVGLEHVVSPTLSLNVSYLWSRGLHLTTVRDLNVGPIGSTVTYRVEDLSGNQVLSYTTPTYRLVNRVDPRWRRVNSVESGGSSYYNALVVQVRKRLSRGFDGIGVYTWAHAIDFNQGGGGDNIFFSEGPRTLWNGNYRGEKASSQLDQRHRLVVSSTYEPELSRGTGWWARWLLQNWRISQISTFASAQPVTPIVLVSGVPFPGAAFNSTLNGFGGSSRVPFYPPSSLDVDQVARTDARITKIFGFRERFRLHLNFEAFNVFNHVSRTAVNTLAFEARNGVLRPLPQLGQGVESQGYPDGTNARRAQVSLRLMW